MFSKPIHRKKHEPENSIVFTARIKIIDQSTAHGSPRLGRGVGYFQRKGCAITAPAGSIPRMNVKVDYDARNVAANTTPPFVAPEKMTSVLFWSHLECRMRA